MDMFLIIQYALISGKLEGADKFTIQAFDSNPIFWTLGVGVASYGLILGILGLGYLGFTAFESSGFTIVKDNNKTFDTIVFILYICFCLFSLL